jgi:hypothetical protein
MYRRYREHKGIWPCQEAKSHHGLSAYPQFILRSGSLNDPEIFKWLVITICMFGCLALRSAIWVVETPFCQWRICHEFQSSALYQSDPPLIHSNFIQIIISSFSKSFIISLPTWANYELSIVVRYLWGRYAYACVYEMRLGTRCKVICRCVNLCLSLSNTLAQMRKRELIGAK